MKALIFPLVCLTLLLTLPTTVCASEKDPFEAILKDYPIGSYFTKNGKACACHASENCVASGKNCNCLRYVTVNGKKIDLLGVQCVGFVRYCQYRLYGAIDYGDTKYRFENLLPSSLSAGKWNAKTAKTYIQKAGIGGHIRIGNHSLIILSVSENGFRSLECNGTTAASACRVFSRSFTWESFYAYYQNAAFRYLNVIRDAYRPTPITTAPPVTTAQTPTTTEAPVTTAPPTTTTQAPITTEAPATTTQAPITTEAPLTTEPPIITDTPMTEESPITPDTPETPDTPIPQLPDVSTPPGAPEVTSQTHLPTPLQLRLPKRDDEDQA